MHNWATLGAENVMTVGELIQELKKYDRSFQVTIHVDNERCEIYDIDDSFIEQGIIELNAEVS